MVETLEALIAHLGRQGRRAKVIVWAHNSHLGDARATAMGRRGELNVGQLVREKYGREAVLVGFTTDHGTVTAASDWDGKCSYTLSLSGARRGHFYSSCADSFRVSTSWFQPHLGVDAHGSSPWAEGPRHKAGQDEIEKAISFSSPFSPDSPAV